MKRSRLFLGITTGLLAFAGVAAAKHFGPSTSRFYCSLGGKCISFSSTCTNTGTTQCLNTFVTVTGDNTTTHSQNVYSSGTNGSTCNGSTICISPVKYSTEHP